MASRLASTDSDAWLHTSDVQLMPLPKYDPNDDASETTDQLALPNEDDADIAPTSSLSSLPTGAATKGAKAPGAAHAAKAVAADFYAHKKHQNPDVAGLKALRNKVLKEDTPSKESEGEREKKIFAKAEQEEAALKKSLHEEAAAKKHKHAAAATQQPAAVKAQPAKAHSEDAAQAPKARTEDATRSRYEKGAVSVEKKKLMSLEERENLEQAMIDTETRKKKASLAHIAAVKDQLEKLERQKVGAQQAAQRAHKHAELEAKQRAKKEQSLKSEMASIRAAERARLAALSAKIKSLGGKGGATGQAAAAKLERAHKPQEKAAVRVQLSAPRQQQLVAKKETASTLARAGPIRAAMSKLVRDEKTTDGILARSDLSNGVDAAASAAAAKALAVKSAAALSSPSAKASAVQGKVRSAKKALVVEPKQPVFADPAREEQLVRNIVEVNQVRSE
eukprot:Tamp_09721.p1 GENE.Tamp_09721~~Tamp_09721.p1  ORF type:complete len:528 (+),score=173.60 Tamp_09721:236-1585(+)